MHVPQPLRVPTKLIGALPFTLKPKASQKPVVTGKALMKKVLYGNLPTPVRAAEDNQTETKRDLLVRLRHLHSDFLNRQHDKMVTRVTKHKKLLKAKEELKSFKERKKKKDFFARKHDKKNQNN